MKDLKNKRDSEYTPSELADRMTELEDSLMELQLVVDGIKAGMDKLSEAMGVVQNVKVNRKLENASGVAHMMKTVAVFKIKYPNARYMMTKNIKLGTKESDQVVTKEWTCGDSISDKDPNFKAFVNKGWILDTHDLK